MLEDDHRAEPDPEQLRKIWKTHIERWKQSGQMQVGYCREHELKPNQFTIGSKDLAGPMMISHLSLCGFPATCRCRSRARRSTCSPKTVLRSKWVQDLIQLRSNS